MATSPDPAPPPPAPHTAGGAAAAADRHVAGRVPVPLLSRPLLALLVAGLAVLLVVLAGEWSYQKAMQSLDSLGRRSQARTAIQTIVRNVLEAESSQRGYLLSGSDAYLRPMHNVRDNLGQSFDKLRVHYARDAELAQALAELERTIGDKLSEVEETLRLHRQGSHEAWRGLMATEFGRERMDHVREAAARLMNSENARVEAERAEIYRTLWIGRVAVIGAILLAALWLVFYVRRSSARHALQRAHAAELRAQRDLLEAEVKARTAELSQLNRHLQDVREVERGSVARILHDELGSLLTAAKLDLTRLRRAMGQDAPAAALTRLEHLTHTIDQGIGLKRRIIEDLMPSALVNLGLVPALEMLCADVQRRTGLVLTVDVQDVVLDAPARIALYRVVEAALSNVEAHAHARAVAVRVAQGERGVVVTVRDDGRGFDGTAPAGPTHQLTVLRHRVESLQGRLEVTSAREQGTQVRVELPNGGSAAEPAVAMAVGSRGAGDGGT